ncbi:aromatic ring-hydroxylating dioxygenase subunit alpha [Phenylobacterium sp.]|jgi:phenylpropionate dioxygenase-like ring-hydroxylating dioxygenase large terminal subunit|uniref:aromatic ring-hydroxylating oxygenase subunit alpha n=1 Tax=Phenylobacterium sp. TaxID=1871053 RepID=UPI002F42F4BF
MMPAHPLDGTIRKDFVPKDDYISREVLELEKERLWSEVWLMACREEQVEAPGDYAVFDIADESILVLRTQKGELKAFYNVCQHRGRRLKDDGGGNTGSSLFCPFHAWRYDLDGVPTRITAREDWDGCPHFDNADLSLKPVRVDTWGGWVWISMKPDIEPLLDYLSPVPELYNNFEFEKCRIGWYVTLRLPCNWKTMLDAFNEAYHVEGTHPQVLKFGGMGKKVPTVTVGRHGNLRVDRNITASRTQALAEGGPKVDIRATLLASSKEINDTLHALQTEYTVAAAERLMTEVPADTPPAEIMATFRKFHREEMEKAGAEWPAKLTDQDVAEAGGTWHVFPNAIILSAYDGAMSYRSRPDGDDVNSCLFDVWWQGRYGPGRQPDWTHETFNDPADFKGRNPFLEQDFGNIRQVQRGMRSRGFTGARTNPYQEATIPNFHRVLHSYLNGRPQAQTAEAAE